MLSIPPCFLFSIYQWLLEQHHISDIVCITVRTSFHSHSALFFSGLPSSCALCHNLCLSRSFLLSFSVQFLVQFYSCSSLYQPQTAAINVKTTEVVSSVLSSQLRNRLKNSLFKVITRCSRVINFRLAGFLFSHVERYRIDKRERKNGRKQNV